MPAINKRTHIIVVQRVDGKKEKAGYIPLHSSLTSLSIAKQIKKLTEGKI
jgi:hypothetical protein